MKGIGAKFYRQFSHYSIFIKVEILLILIIIELELHLIYKNNYFFVIRFNIKDIIIIYYHIKY